MKNCLHILMISLLLIGTDAIAQTPQFYTGNSGSPSNAFPYATTTGKGIQWLVLPGEFTGATGGLITKFYTQGTASATFTLTSLTIKMTQDVITTLPTGVMYSPINTVVFSAASIVVSSTTAGWVSFTLQTPFSYDPTKSLIIEVDQCGSTGGFSVTNVSKTGTIRRTFTNPTSCIQAYSGQGAELANLGIDISSNRINDGGILSINKPTTPMVPGIDTVKATLKNFGTDTLKSINLRWSVNGINQTNPSSWSGSLPQGSTSGQLTFGAYNFTAGIYFVKAWTVNPNGVLDSNALNDTAKLTIFSCNPANGTYVIDPSGGGDFTSFGLAIEMLKNCGIAGPVNFRVKAGIYNEQLTIPVISGASSTNRITFESYDLDSTKVNLTYAAKGTTDNWVLLFNGCDYVTFRKISITATGTTYGNVVEFISSADYNTLESNIIQTSITTATTLAGVYSSTTLDQYNTIKNNVITGGYYGIYWYGVSTSSFELGNVIEGNIIQDFYQNGITPYYQDAIKIKKNKIRNTSTSATAYGIYSTYCRNSIDFSQNDIYLTASGTIYGLYMANDVGTTTLRGTVSNNFIATGGSSTGTVYGVYLATTSYQDISYNSVRIGNNSTTSRALYITAGTASTVFVRNNNLTNFGGGYAIYTGAATTALGTCNYNNLYTSGTNLGFWTANNTTIAAWRTASAKDANSVSGNPGYYTNSDLHVNNAGISNLGTPISGLTIDIDGETRNVTNPDIGADEFNLVADDAGVTGLVASGLLCPGGYSPSVKVKNYGTSTLTSVKIGWSVNGVVQSPDTTITVSLTQYQEATVSLRSYTVNNGISYNFKCWASQPNGIADGNTRNDTFVYNNITTSFVGTYTIGGSSGNFPTFNAALSALINKGICGPVEFIVNPGTYTERVVIPTIMGSSSTNTITFRGANQSNVILTYAGSSATLITTVLLSGADYVTFKNMTIQNTGTTYGSAVMFIGAADYNTIDSCLIIVDTVGTGSTVIAISSNNIESSTATAGNCANYTTISNCTIKGGYYGVRFYGTSTSVKCTNNSVTNSTFYKVYYYGGYYYYQTFPTFSNNYLSAFRGSTCYGIYNYYGGMNPMINRNTIYATYGIYNYYYNYNSQIKENKIYNASYGIYNYYYNDNSQIMDNTIRASIYGIYNYYYNTSTNIERNDINGGYMGIYCYYENYTGTDSSTIFNNLIRQGGNTSYAYGYAINMVTSGRVNIYNNTLQTDSTYSSAVTSYGTVCVKTSRADIKIKNNIIKSYGNMPCFTTDGTYITAGNLDYNIYYTSTGNLVAYWGSTSYTSFMLWKSVMLNYNQNSMSFNPELISKYNLHLASTAPYYKGIKVGVDKDVDSDPRCVPAPTIGGDEFIHPYSKPVADFYMDTMICTNSPYTFINKAGIDEPKTHFWYVNNSLMSNSYHFSFKFISPGIDTVSLVTYNCSSSDTMTKIFRVDTAFKTPESYFIADRNLIEVNEEIAFLDLSTSCPEQWKWSVYPDSIDDPILGYKTPTYFVTSGTITSQLPKITFLYSGKYTICLTTYNSIDTGTTYCVNDYIEVKPSAILCVYPFDSKEQYGTLYDEGGFNGMYLNNKTCRYSIHPCTKEVRLVFKIYDIYSDDYLRIFDGPDNKSRPLWNVLLYPQGINNGNFIPSLADTFIATTGVMFIELATNASNQANGFIANWTSDKSSYIQPVASFDISDTVCNGIPTVFHNTSTGDQNDNFWDFENDNYTDANTVDGVFTYMYDGDYDVRLMVSGCGGSDTIVKKINVKTATAAPEIEIIADNYTPNVFNDVVNISENTLKNCVDTTIWNISPKTYTIVSGSLFNSYQLALKFNDTVCYDFSLIGIYHGVSDTVFYPCFIKPLLICKPVATYISTDIGISRVALNKINNYSDIGITEYSDFTSSVMTELEIGARYNITIERRTNFNPIRRKVWIDYNLDGKFDDQTELAAYDSSSYTISWNGLLRLSKNVGLITTRMRVGTSLGGASNTPCGPNMLGEFEDYKVRFIPDRTKPIISLLGANVLHLQECTPSFVDPGVIATDNVSTGLVDSVKVTGTVDTKIPGTYFVHYNVKDETGNAADEQMRTVIVDPEITPPQLMLNGSLTDTILVYSAYVDPGYQAYDTCSGLQNVGITSTLDTSLLGIYSITYTADDKAGNSVVASRTIHVIDNISPVISSTSQDTIIIEVYQLLPNPIYSVTDNYYQYYHINITIKGTYYETFPNGEATALGIYTFRYVATDGSGNSDSIDFVIKVVDVVKPLLQLKGFFYYKLCRFDTLIDPGYIISDNYDKNPTVFKSGSYITDYLVNRRNGDYELIYSAYDQSGNRASDLRYIFVTDQDDCYSLVESDRSKGIRLYPNLGDGRFSLVFNIALEQNMQIVVYDVLGNVITDTREVIKPGQIISCNYSDFKQGMYFIRVSDGVNTTTFRYNLVKN